MIVLDASALTDWLLGTPAKGSAVASEIRRARFLHTLDLADVEVISALRRKAMRRELDDRRAEEALSDLAAVPMRRHRAAPLAQRIWDLRGSHSADDAAYLALAEALSMPMLTTDSRLARSRRHGARVIEASPET